MKQTTYHSGCIICGKPLIYSNEEKHRICSICGNKFWSQAECEDGHYVCDECHAKGIDPVLTFLKTTAEAKPSIIMEQVWKMPEVHLFGPEHHRILPCVLLAAYRNSGGTIKDTDFDTAWERGTAVIGGTCGYWGVCGAAIGMGIFFSILYSASPMSCESWSIVQRFASICLARIAMTNGPRCCKRTCRIAINTAVELVNETSSVQLLAPWSICEYSVLNNECLMTECPFYEEQVN